MGALRRGWARTPLWARLVAGALLLSAVALGVTGAVGAGLLRGYLIGQVDYQLRESATHIPRQAVLSGEARPGSYYMGLADNTGKLEQTLVSPFRGAPAISAPDIVHAPSGPFTAPLAGQYGERWRMYVKPYSIGDGTKVYVVVASDLADVDNTVGRLMRIDLAAGVVVLAALAVAGYAMVRVSLRPLRGIERTAAAIAAGDLSQRVPEEPPGTEVGRLSRSLNGMLTQIEGAFRARERSESAARDSERRMRTFVADAGHELRTPLTSIRGFAELHRQRGDAATPAETDELIGRIEGSATAMGLLVDDLLLLARLDQQRPLERAPVNLVELAADVVIDARARAPEREIEITGIGIAEGDPVVVTGDGPRLRQILANLVNNALMHTPDGTPVTVGVGFLDRDGPRSAVMQVEDLGPGLEAEQAARVFERFYRADSSRTRAQGGTGLGLSIVASLAAAHGGTAEVETAPGQGATFRVLIPADA
ncbi:MAG TPA: HAMP domain-containing sensor histidine kinase [Streptosporangiaceae bacterium]|jgi:two-component system OmpR family sensor kinase